MSQVIFRHARGTRVVVAVVAAAVVAVVAWQSALWASDEFADVPHTNPHHDSIGAIVDGGVTSGCGGNLYCPGDPVRRDQMGTFMDQLGALSGQQPIVNAATAQQASDSNSLGGVDAQELLDRLEALEEGGVDSDLADRVDALEDDLAAATDRIDDLEAENAALQTLLADVSRDDDEFGRDTLTFSDMNVQVVNGTGSTAGEPNGLGNLLVGYNTTRPGDSTGAEDRAGSHSLVVGDWHHWTEFGHLIAGAFNTANGEWSSVTGGTLNTTNDDVASVSGGTGNEANGQASSVLGGNVESADSTNECHPGC